MGLHEGDGAEAKLTGSVALVAFGGLLAWGFSTRHLGLRGGSLGYALAMVGLGYLCVRASDAAGWLPSRAVRAELARTWASVLVVVLAVSVGIAFGLRTYDPALTRRLGLSSLLGISNWFSSAAPLQGQLAEPDPLIATAFTSVAAQLALLWWVLSRWWRRGASALALGMVVVGFAVQLLWLAEPTTAFFSTLTYATPFGLGALAALRGSSLQRLPSGRVLWLLALGLALSASLLLPPTSHLYRYLALPIVSLAAAAALCVPLPIDRRRAAQLARFALWPALLGFAARALLSPHQLHLHGVALFAVQLAVTLVASVAGYQLVAALPRVPASARPILGLAAVPALVFTLVLVDVSTKQTTFPPGILHAGKAPIVPHAFPNPEHHLRTLMVGGTDAFGLSFGVAATAERRGVMMNSDAVTECGLVNGQQVILDGEPVRQDRGWRPGVGWVRCSTQLDRWRADLKVLRPKVVVLAEGSSEVRTWLVKGEQRSILDADVAEQVRAALTEAITVLGSRGAAVVVTTAPYYGVGVPLGRYGNPANNPDRVNAYNRILRSVAKATGASVYNLNRPVCPARRFQLRAHGFVMRGNDGVTVTERGGRYVQPALLAKLKAVAP